MRVAVVGSGISGLVTAYLLQRQHEVTLWEANNYLGGHTNTVDVQSSMGPLAIDTGFIVFNDWTYPNFIGLLQELEVASKPTSMGFAVRCERCGLEYSGNSIATLFAQKRNLFSPSHYRLLWDILRFNKESIQLSLADDSLTLGEFLQRGNYSAGFAEHYLLPMGAAIWSCPMATFAEFPLRFIVEFYRNHGLLNVLKRPTWHVVEGGSRTYVECIRARFRGDVRLNSPVQRVARVEHGVELSTASGTHRFDEVVFACHSDQALRILCDPTPLERELLTAFPYSKNVALLHTDTSVLPQRKNVWSSWNYLIRPGEETRPAVTYNMNILQQLSSPETYSVTLNAEDLVRPETVVGEFQYEHPVFTTRRGAAQERHAEVIRNGRTSFCGAYWRNGFHEDGVVSALRVCAAFGIVPEWSQLPQRNPVFEPEAALVG